MLEKIINHIAHNVYYYIAIVAVFMSQLGLAALFLLFQIAINTRPSRDN